MSKVLPTIFSLERYERPRKILVIGCGGTGAFVISHLARLFSTFGEDHSYELLIADGDIVEEKNLLRQHFISQDIGKNKAEVLAERYAAAFGIQISAITEHIEKEKFLISQANYRATLIIGCVDNNATRKLIHNTFFAKDTTHNIGNNLFWIDSGNEESNGQVVCGCALPRYVYYGTVINTQIKNPRTRAGVFSLPCVTELYPEILSEKSKFNSQLSCAERAASAPQNMMTNVTAATIVTNYAQKIILGMPLNSHAVEFSIKNNFSTRLNTKENLFMVNKSRKSGGEEYGADY